MLHKILDENSAFIGIFYSSHKEIVDKVRCNFSPCKANNIANILNDNNKTIHKDTSLGGGGGTKKLCSLTGTVSTSPNLAKARARRASKARQFFNQ